MFDEIESFLDLIQSTCISRSQIYQQSTLVLVSLVHMSLDVETETNDTQISCSKLFYKFT
jgi:hypothetical protein